MTTGKMTQWTDGKPTHSHCSSCGGTHDNLVGSCPRHISLSTSAAGLVPTMRVGVTFVMPTTGRDLANAVWSAVQSLTPEERVEFFGALTGEWCQYCGREHPGYPCRCEDDE